MRRSDAYCTEKHMSAIWNINEGYNLARNTIGIESLPKSNRPWVLKQTFDNKFREFEGLHATNAR